MKKIAVIFLVAALFVGSELQAKNAPNAQLRRWVDSEQTAQLICYQVVTVVGVTGFEPATF